MKIEAPSGALRLGEEARLAASVEGPPVRYVSAAQQRMENGGGPCARGGKDEASLQRNADGRDFVVSFVPQCLGKIRIHVFVTFIDGGAAFQEVPVEVIAGPEPTYSIG